MIHLDLFSGIGGFAYAADQVFGDVEHIFCDNDPFCRQVLKKHWPEAKIYDDIRSITSNADLSRHFYRQPKEQPAERHDKTLGKPEPGVRPPAIQPDITDTNWHGLQKPRTKQQTGGDRQLPKVKLLTGGFPCQPFSAAGLRRGTADARHLWPEMLRVIKLTKPEWVIAENVRGILTWNGGLVFEQVCTDLEAEGYSVQPFIIPAVAVNAPHRRDRVWFIGHAKHNGELRAKRTGQDSGLQRQSTPRQKLPVNELEGGNSLRTAEDRRDFAANPSDRGKRSSQQSGYSQRQQEAAARSGNRDDTDTQRQGLQVGQAKDSSRLPSIIGEDRNDSWSQNWLEVATKLCGVDDGLSAELDEFKLTKPQHRQERLKSLGNAIVPQVAIEIMKGMI